MKWRVFEVRLGERGGSYHVMGGRGMRSLGSSKFSTPRTSRDWLQLELLFSLFETRIIVTKTDVSSLQLVS